MDGKKIALLVGALFVAAVTAIMAKSMFNSSATPQVVAAIAPQPTGPQVLVATKALPVGTIIGPDAVRFQPWPKDVVDGAYYIRGKDGADPTKLQGMVVRSEITAGQPLTQGALVSPQDRGFLAAALTPGMRAITVSVGGASGVAGFVFPGDRVDLVLTQDVAGGGDNASGQLHTSETIIRNIRVLATDQRVDNKPNSEGQSDVRNFSMVTLEATPKMAEEIAVAQKLGALTLSLRPLADNAQAVKPETAYRDGGVPSTADARTGRTASLDASGHPQDSQTTFTTGGEVSRFARMTMPRGGAAPANGTQQGTPAFDGPVVRVARANAVTVTPMGGK